MRKKIDGSWTGSARKFLPQGADPQFLNLPQAPLVPGEKPAQHYLDVISGLPPLTTRTRAESAAGPPPPEWLKGAHGECLKVKPQPPCRKKLKQAPPEDVSDESGGEEDVEEVLARLRANVDPAIATLTDALATQLDIMAESGVLKIKAIKEIKVTRSITDALSDNAKTLEIDPFEITEHLMKVMIASGYSAEEVSDVVGALRFYISRAQFEENSGQGGALKFFANLCTEVSYMVARSEMMMNSYLYKIHSSEYTALCDEIDEVDEMPPGVKRAQDKVLKSGKDFCSCLIQFKVLLKDATRFDQASAIDAKDLARDAGESDLMWKGYTRTCDQFHKRHSEWKNRLFKKFLSFSFAHTKIQAQIQQLNDACGASKSELRKNEVLMVEWQNRLTNLGLQKERRLGGNVAGMTKFKMAEQDLLKEHKIVQVEEQFLADEIEQHETIATQNAETLRDALTDICCHEWIHDLREKDSEMKVLREASALRCEDVSSRLVMMHQVIDVTKIKDVVDNLQGVLIRCNAEYVACRTGLEAAQVKHTGASKRIQELETTLKAHGHAWSVDCQTGLVHSRPVMSMPLMVLRAYRDVVRRQIRTRTQDVSQHRKVPVKTAETPAGSQASPQDLSWDRRAAMFGADRPPLLRQCLANSSSLPCLLDAGGTEHKAHRLLLKLQPSIPVGLGLAPVSVSELVTPLSPRGGTRLTEALDSRQHLADWPTLHKRWQALWKEMQRLGGVHAHDVPLLRPELLNHVQLLILDACKNASVLETMETTLRRAMRICSKQFTESGMALEAEDTELLQYTQRQWDHLVHLVVKHEERQQSIGAIVALLVLLQGRLVSVSRELRTLSEETEDISFAARTMTSDGGKTTELVGLKDKLLEAHLKSANLTWQAKSIHAEVESLFGPQGPVNAMVISALHSKDLEQFAPHFMDHFCKNLERRKKSVESLVAARQVELVQRRAQYAKFVAQKKKEQAKEAVRLERERAEAAELAMRVELERREVERRASQEAERIAALTAEAAAAAAERRAAAEEDEKSERSSFASSSDEDALTNVNGDATRRQRGVGMGMGRTASTGSTKWKKMGGVSCKRSQMTAEERAALPQEDDYEKQNSDVTKRHKDWEKQQHLYGPGSKSGVAKLRALVLLAMTPKVTKNERRTSSKKRLSIVNCLIEEGPRRPSLGNFQNRDVAMEMDARSPTLSSNSSSAEVGMVHASTAPAPGSLNTEMWNMLGRSTSPERDPSGKNRHQVSTDSIDLEGFLDEHGDFCRDETAETENSRGHSKASAERAALLRRKLREDRIANYHLGSKRLLMHSHLDCLQGIWETEKDVRLIRVGEEVHPHTGSPEPALMRKRAVGLSPRTNKQDTDEASKSNVVTQSEFQALSERFQKPGQQNAKQSLTKTEGTSDAKHGPAGKHMLLTAAPGFAHGGRPRRQVSGGSVSDLDADDVAEDLGSDQSQDEEIDRLRHGYIDVDMPLEELHMRPETPAWIQNMLEQASLLSPSAPAEAQLDMDHMTPLPPTLVAQQSPPQSPPQTGRTPSLLYPHPGLSMTSRTESKTESRAESRTECASRHLWLPLGGVDGRKTCSHPMPLSLANRLSPELRVSPSAERSREHSPPGASARDNDINRADAAQRQLSPPGASAAPSRARSPAPPRPHTVEPGALPNCHRKKPMMGRPNTSLAAPMGRPNTSLAAPMGRPNTSLGTHSAQQAPSRPSSRGRYFEVDQAKLLEAVELPTLSWLPGAYTDVQKHHSRSATPKVPESHRPASARETLPPNAPNMSVLSRGFTQQMQKALTFGSKKQHRNTPDEVGSAHPGKGAWSGVSGIHSRAAAKRPRP